MKNLNHSVIRPFIAPASRLLSLMIVLFLSADSVFGQTHTAVTASVADNIKGYWEYLPADYKTTTKNYPLLLFFHGIGEIGSGSTTDLQKVLKNGPPKLINNGTFPKSFTVNGATHSFIVISPQFTNTTRTTTAINNLINYCKTKYRVDASRIYLTGLSHGGGTAWFYPSMDANNGKKLAAMLVVCGNLPAGDNYAAKVAASNLPVMITHNRNDPTVNINTTSIAWYNKLNATTINPKSKLNIFEVSGHDAWSATYDPTWKYGGLNVYEWMLQYTRGTTTTTNKAPVASAKASASTITLPTNSVTLDGSGSTDSDGSIKSYAWSYVSGPAGYSLTNAATSKATASNLSAGTYSFKLTVTDDKGTTATATVSVVVNAAANKAPVVSAKASASTITLPTNSVTLDGSGSTDSDGSIKTYAWSYVSGPAGYSLTNAATSKATASNLSAGTYSFKLAVTDDKSATATATVSVVVNSATNAAPIAAATPSASSLTLPSNSVTLDGTASKDNDGSIKTYGWTCTSGPAGYSLTNAATSKATASNLAAGTYAFKLTVTDDDGATGTATTTVVVNNTTSTTTAVITGVSSITLPTNSLTLSGTSSIGNIKSYAWKFVKGSGGYAYGYPYGSTFKIYNLSQGTRTFQLTVKDDKGVTSTTQFTFTVNKASARVTTASGANTATIEGMEAAPVEKSVTALPSVKVWPVPARDFININLDDETEGKVTIRILDISGKPAIINNGATKGSRSLQSRVDVSKLKPGIYYYEIIVGDKRQTGKFLKLGN